MKVQVIQQDDLGCQDRREIFVDILYLMPSIHSFTGYN